VSTTSDAVTYNPYAYEIHEDPYPTYARLRDEAPLYRNEEMGFWALSRHADVIEGFRDSERSPTRTACRSTPRRRDPTPTGRCRSWRWTRRMHGRMRGLVSRASPPTGRRAGTAHP
jgi:cytochrome P450